MADHIFILTPNPTIGGTVAIQHSNGSIGTGTYYGSAGTNYSGKTYY